MLTIDRLIEILMTEETDDAGMRAVVRALRDEVSKHDYLREVDFMFNEILGAAEREAAGGSSSNADKATEAGGARCATTSASAPATTHCPVCNGKGWDRFDSPCPPCEATGRVPATDPCPRCGYPAQDQCDSPGCNIDPAPAVCVWEGGNWDWVSDCGAVQEDPPLTSSCLYCGLPIKFTEAQR